MKKYAAFRLVSLLPVVLIVSVIVFGLVNVLPGDPVRAMFGPGAEVSEEMLAQRRESLNLDRSIPARYGIWITDLARGDLGVSIRTDEPVAVVIRRALPPTLWLAGASLAFALALALPVGIAAASSSRRWVHAVAGLLTLGGISVPVFVIGIGLVLVFSIQLGLLPAVGYTSPTEDFWQFLRNLLLPAITQGLHLAAILAITIRHHVAEELSSDYVRTAHSKGLPRRTVMVRHVFRNAITGILGIAAWLLISQIGGAIVIETLFAWPGLGRLAHAAITGRDYPVIQGIVFLTAILFILVNLGVDLFGARLDPRIRLGKRLGGTR